MAQLLNGNQIKLNSGKIVQGQEGSWYDAMQLFGGSLSAPGVINANSNQQGAGQAVSKEVVQQTNPANWAYIQQQQQAYKPSGTPQPTNVPSGSPSGASGAGAGLGMTTPETIDPAKLYETAYANSGIRDVEAGLLAKQNAYNEQVSKIKDNPYLSEATMTGRIKKISDKFDADANNIKNDIAMRKADVETQLNLQLKKFDIDSQAAKDAFSKLNSLLSSGFLDNASGEDIANLTRSSGVSSSMIQSAISVNQKKNAPKVSISQFDDGTNVYAVAVDENGNVTNRQVIGQSKPEKATGGKKEKDIPLESKANQLLESNKNSYGHVSPDIWQQILSAYIADGGTKAQFVKEFSTYADFNRGDFKESYGFSL